MNKDLLHEASVRGFKTGSVIRHFKGGLYYIVCVAEHTETGEPFMVYRSLNSDKAYARPLEMFLSKTDKEKYPDVKQEYRFEVVGDE